MGLAHARRQTGRFSSFTFSMNDNDVKPAPANPSDRVAGEVYSTPKGVFLWTGKSWAIGHLQAGANESHKSTLRHLWDKVSLNKAILIIYAALTTVMMLFPPFFLSARGIRFNLGHGFLFNPPTQGMIQGSVDVPLLLTQMLCASTVAAVAWFVSKD